MAEETRMAGDYEIQQSMSIGEKEVVIGENPAADPGQRYLCAYCEHNDFFNLYTDAQVSDSYAEVVQLYAQRIGEESARLQAERENLQSQGIDLAPITAAGCRVMAHDDDLNGKIIVIKANVLRDEYQNPTHQLKLCTGGFGASPHSRGSAVFCTDLYSGKESRFERWDVLGTMEPDALPEWAKKGLAEIQQKQAEKQKKPKDREAR